MKLTSSIAAFPRVRACVGAIAALCILGPAPSQATVTTYSNIGTFFNALQDPAYFESFNSHSGQTLPSPEAFTFGPVGFTLSETASGDIHYSSGTPSQGSVFPATGGTPLSFVLNFTGNVTAVGGTFFMSDLSFAGVAGAVTATLGTGEVVTLMSTTSYSTEPFGGFTSTTPITSLTITGNGAGFVSLDNLYISGTAAPAPVPEPGAWALLAGGGAVLLFAARRRRAAAAR